MWDHPDAHANGAKNKGSYVRPQAAIPRRRANAASPAPIRRQVRQNAFTYEELAGYELSPISGVCAPIHKEYRDDGFKSTAKFGGNPRRPPDQLDRKSERARARSPGLQVGLVFGRVRMEPARGRHRGRARRLGLRLG